MNTSQKRAIETQSRDEIERGVQAEPPSGRDIWQALRGSPFVDLNFEVEREFSAGRDISL